jgi:predicted SnoaL-like aldol condensation-catalyzing enzyme
MNNAKNTVLTAAGELFGQQDPSAVDRWVAADYTQHSTLAADGPEALRQLVAGLPESFGYEGAREHNPEAADGLDGFGAAAAKWAEQGKNLVYKTVHKVIAEGDFVLLQSEGEFGVPVAYYDLFRVQGGKIVEHWDVISPIPAEVPHGNGLF